MERKRKTLGVIGGMGPEATSYYYENVIAHTKASCDQEHIDMVILSHAAMPDRTEAIISGNSRRLINMLCNDVRTLETLGVSNIAITCNTSHYFYDHIQRATKIPVIHMIQESVAYAVRDFEDVKRVGIMATDGTINSKIYYKACRKAGVTPVKLSEERQKDVMSLIYDDIKAGKPGDRRKFDRVVSEFMRKGCDVIILACTELSVFKGKHDVPSICLDAMDVLVKESILRSDAEYI
ncbi:MAG: aspartate/glutamate racemase family protein [Dorea sp.]|nr:aspartate/glutamate racemase family protein [Dorea sp.]